MRQQKTTDVQASYDAVADEYVRRIFDELQHKPLDRELLHRFTDRTRGAGLVCDLGCGPGHVARYLHDHGVQVCGVDLSNEMVARARRLNPEIQFWQDDMLALTVPNACWAGIVAFYTIVNLPPGDVATAAAEMFRVLRPGGLLLLSFHIGDELVHLDQWWDQSVSIDFYFFATEKISAELAAAEFEIENVTEREPYPDVEHPSRRAYIVARKP